jgi:RHS repeat-associated protein
VGPEGQRLRKQTSSGTTYFAPDSGGTLLAEDDNGIWVDYVWLNGRLIGRIAGSTVDAIHTDQTGRPQVVTDAGQAVVWKATNYPFEREVALDTIGGLNLGFPGQYYDAERGLWNNGFRDYNASLGRYIESDPIGLDGGINTYAYVVNNPLGYTDPLGLDFLGKCLAQQYLDKYGADAWDKIRGDRNSTQPVIPGTNSEAMRNAEHYLYNYNNIQRNSYSWGPDLALTIGYEVTKFWANVGDYYGAVKSPWGYSVPTSDELEAGIEGANDALFGNSSKSSCGCGGQ